MVGLPGAYPGTSAVPFLRRETKILQAPLSELNERYSLVFVSETLLDHLLIFHRKRNTDPVDDWGSRSDWSRSLTSTFWMGLRSFKEVGHSSYHHVF